MVLPSSDAAGVFSEIPERTILTFVPLAISTVRSSPSESTTFPRMPPVVTTLSPLFISASIFLRSLPCFCWGLIIRK